MDHYIDIHSHILPGIDDGSKDIFTSMQMLKTAADNGITGIIATPHNKPMRHNAGSSRIASLIRSLTEHMKDQGIDLELYAGNELYYRSGLTDEIAEGKALTMAGGDYVLVEFGPMDDFGYIRNGIYSLAAEGYRPILAHAERYYKLSGRLDQAAELKEMGCYIQVNAESVMGKSGALSRLFTRKLLKEQLVHFIATDAHDTGRRSPKLAECASYIGRKYGRDYMQELFYENPMRMIRNEYI